MKYLLLALTTMLLLQGCTSVPAKEMGDTIKECTANGLGFQTHTNGFNNITWDITCCVDNSQCNTSRLEEK